MDWKARFKPLADDLTLRKFFTGWLRSFLLGVLFALLAFLNEAGPLAIALVAANVGLLSFFVIDRANNKGAAQITVTVLVLVGLAALGWSVWQKHKATAQYQLVVDGYTILRAGRSSPTGEGQVTGINARLDVGNKYNFPLYCKIERQYAKIGHQSSRLDNPGASVRPMVPSHAVFLESDLVPALLENGKYHEAEVEF